MSSYTPIAEHLPAVYAEDPASHDELTGYLALFDTALRAQLAALDDVTTWLSPSAARVEPPGLDPGRDAARQAYEALQDELAGWFGFRFPDSWREQSGQPLGEAAWLERRRQFLLRAARLWRRRGTPRGFHAWFCCFFGLEAPAAGQPDPRPILLEHFKYRPPAAQPEDYALRITLLVPLGPAFRDFARRREAVRFLEREAPAHLLTRLCWFDPAAPPDLSAVANVRTLLERITSFVPLADGIRLDKPPDVSRPNDLLGEGALPGGGD